MTQNIEYQVLKDFEFENLGGDEWKITKYIGFDIESGNIEIPSTIGDKKITSIGAGIFKNDPTIKNVKISDGIKTISEDAFSLCNCLESIILPNTLETVGDKAFYICKRLKSITFPNSVKEIGESICESCNSLTDVVLPDNLSIIPKSAFQECKALKRVALPKNIKEIKKFAFMSCVIEQLKLPDSLEIIEDCALLGHRSEILSLPKGIKYIGEEAISSSTLKKLVLLPGCEAHLGDGCLHSSLLTDVYIPSSITQIGNVFKGTNFFIYENQVTDEDGKYVRNALGDIVTETKVQSFEGEEIPSDLTIHCELGSPIMNYAKSKKVKCADYNTGLAAVQEELAKIAEEEQYKIELAKKYPIEVRWRQYECDKKLIGDESPFFIPNYIKMIEAKAFERSNFRKYAGYMPIGKAKLAEEIFQTGSQIELIEQEAFQYVDFEKSTLRLPQSLKKIEKRAFAGCSTGHITNLKKVYIPQECEVEEGAFDEACEVIRTGSEKSTSDLGNKAVDITNKTIDKLKGLFEKFKK